MNFYVAARSIDGSVYAVGLGCWTLNFREAKAFTFEDAEKIVSDQRERNGRCNDQDDVIGRLQILELKS